MWRAVLIAGTLALAGILAPTGASMSTAKSSSRGSSGRWDAPVTVVPAGTATESLGLAATPAGSALAGWVQGSPPKVFVGGPVGPGARAAGVLGAQAQAAPGQEVRIAEGSVVGGLRRTSVLSTGPSGSFSNLYVTLSSPDVGYVVWEGRYTALRLGVVRNGRTVVANRRLVRDAVPLALFALSRGRAAVVFDKYGHGTPWLEYGLLSATGRIGKITRIAHPGSHDSEATELSVNPRGELIASWVHNDGASRPGTSPTSRGFVAARLVVTLCRPALHCAAPETVPLGTTKPACINPAVAISPADTATVIAAADDWGVGCDAPLGVRVSVTQATSTKVRPMRLIQAEGDWPIAEPVGQAGTVWVLNSGLASADAFSSSFLPAAGSVHPRTSLLDGGVFWNTGAQLLAPASNGWYVITWSHANRRDNPDVSLDAAVGHDGQLQRTSVVLGATHHVWSYLGATDGRGDAMILFSGSTDTGDGAPWPYSSGLYTTVRRR